MNDSALTTAFVCFAILLLVYIGVLLMLGGKKQV